MTKLQRSGKTPPVYSDYNIFSTFWLIIVSNRDRLFLAWQYSGLAYVKVEFSLVEVWCWLHLGLDSGRF